MNVLQRTMFAEGDAVNSPVKDPLTEIANYSLSGLAPIQIFEIMQADYAEMGLDLPFGMATIERIAQQVGGSMKENPNLVGPNIPTDVARAGEMGTGPFNIFPETTFSDPNVLLPQADPSLSNRLPGSNNPLTQPESIEQMLGDVAMGTTDTSELPEVQQLGPNEIRLSNGKIVDFSQGIQDIKDGKGVGMHLYRIFNSPDVERGANVDEALKQFITEDEPGIFRMLGGLSGGTLDERRGKAFGPEDFGSGITSFIKGAVDVGREGLERTIPGVVDLFGGKKLGDKARDFFEGEFGEGYQARGGFSPETIDNIVVAAAGSGSIENELEKLSAEGGAGSIIKPETGEPEFILEEGPEGRVGFESQEDLDDYKNSDEYKNWVGEPLKGDDFIPGAEGDETGDESIAVEIAEAVTTGDDSKPSSPSTYSRSNTPETNFAQFTQSPDFIRFIRNLGKGMVSTGEMGKGIALGSAAAAEEKYVDEKEAKLLAAELAKEKSKLKSKYDDPVYLKMVRDSKVEVATQHRTYEEAESTRALTASVIQFLDDGNITDFSARLGVAQDRLLTIAGLGPEDIEDQSPRERAQNALIILKQKNIKAILNESSRTISNVDREIADKIAGSLDDFDLTTEGGLKQKLGESLRSAKATKNEAVRKARAEYDLLLQSGDHLTLDEAVISFITGKLSSTEKNKNKGFGYDPSITFIDTTQ